MKKVCLLAVMLGLIGSAVYADTTSGTDGNGEQPVDQAPQPEQDGISSADSSDKSDAEKKEKKEKKVKRKKKDRKEKCEEKTGDLNATDSTKEEPKAS